MRYRILVLETARQDIYEIKKYISDTLLNPVSAEKIVNKIWDKIESLEHTPKRSHIRKNYYKVRVKRYKIFYEINGNTVRVLHIKHMRQNFKI